jgi:transcriptional regulator with XRE-family HTH domain
MSSREAPGEKATSGLDPRTELREFLRSRRARLRPEDVGLPSYGRRRVPGLRREELAQLAGVSYAYYARLEQGFGDTMSAEVLDAVAHALRLTEDEHAHLFGLAQPERQSPTQAALSPHRLRPTVQHLLDTLGVPAYVVGRRMDILGWNRLAVAVFGDWAPLPPEQRNVARMFFLSPETRDRFADPERTALKVVGILRMHAGQSRGDPRLASLIEELSRKSEEFRRLWARHEVGCGGTGIPVRMRHPLVGEFDLVSERMLLTDDSPQLLIAYYAEPGSRSEEALRMLASWEMEPLR